VWAADVNEYRAELAATVGADEAGRTPKDADIVVECAGAKGTVDLAVASATAGGQVVLLAVNVKGDTVWPFVWVTKEVDIVPCLGYTLEEYREAVGWIATGRVDVAPLITKRIGLDGTDEAFTALLDGAPEAKVLVVP
jgi:threonine dehydrogenase-like Zn-dependent dehydrogenase